MVEFLKMFATVEDGNFQITVYLKCLKDMGLFLFSNRFLLLYGIHLGIAIILFQQF